MLYNILLDLNQARSRGMQQFSIWTGAGEVSPKVHGWTASRMSSLTAPLPAIHGRSKSRRPRMAESDQSSSPENRKDRGFPGFRFPLYGGSAPVMPPDCLILRTAGVEVCISRHPNTKIQTGDGAFINLFFLRPYKFVLSFLYVLFVQMVPARLSENDSFSRIIACFFF